MKKILLVLGILIFAGLFWFEFNRQLNNTVSVTEKKSPIVIGFALGSTREERWFTDRDLFVKKIDELGGATIVALSDYDVDLQISQIQNLISQGIKVIVVVPADSEKIAPVIEEAHNAGVKIIAYDRLINNADLDLYVSFDNKKVGQLEAESVLKVKDKGNFAYIGGAPTDNNSALLKSGSMAAIQDKIKNGDIKLVVDEFTPDWRPEEAQKTIKTYLDKGGKLDAVIAANDGTAFGVIQALQAYGLSGKIPVSGQDADLSACRRIIAGTQTSTIYKPIQLLADQAAISAMAMAEGNEPDTNSLINNGKIEVLSYLIEPTLITKDNMQETVVKDGFHTYAEIYKK